LLKDTRSADLVAVRDCELLLIPTGGNGMPAIGGFDHSRDAMARLCARRLRRSNRRTPALKRARVFVIVPNNDEIDMADLGDPIGSRVRAHRQHRIGMDVRASSPHLGWFHRIEESNDFVVYVAGPEESGLDAPVLPAGRRDSFLAARAQAGIAARGPIAYRTPPSNAAARIELALVA